MTFKASIATFNKHDPMPVSVRLGSSPVAKPEPRQPLCYSSPCFYSADCH